jgi:enoyl-CoA hydratase/carnithine racemase
MDYSKADFSRFLDSFTSVYTYLFEFPKPVIAAVNGHAIAGGCMLVTACDYRVMASGTARVSLNEVTFGASLLAGSVEMLKYCVGERNAEIIAGGGEMYVAEDALRLGLIDAVVEQSEVMPRSRSIAAAYADKYGPAFAGIKALLRRQVAERMRSHEVASIDEFIDIWYSEKTREQLRKIKIHS